MSPSATGYTMQTPSPIITISKSSSPELDPAPAFEPNQVVQDRDASFAALEGSAPSAPSKEENRKDSETLPRDDDRGLGIAFDFGLDQVPTTGPTTATEQTQSHRQSNKVDAVENMRRISVDSASSYGSIGFTDRTFSSRSSPPPPDETTRKRLEPTTQLALEDNSHIAPPPPQPRADESMAESPTVPFDTDGHLTAYLAKNDPAAVVTASIDTSVVSPPPQDRRVSSSSSVFSDSNDVDMVPMQGFRPRKDSLAGAPPPLFHKSTLPARTSSRPAVGESKSTQSSMEMPLPTHSPRQDSLSSVSSRNASKGTCRGCSQPILGMQKSVSSADGRLSGKYHKECFVCHTCKEAFATAEFYVHADQPYCAHHYHKLEDSLCATCGKGIEGLYMETANVAGRGKEKHHPACLKCTTCRVQLTDDYFELSGKVYCERDAFRLAKHPRVHSRGPARPSPLVREYIRSGTDAINGSNFPERRLNRPILQAR
ncbi:Paxillin-like protein 1 [Cyphellophora attinorum]|uniref:Paxillin-like protein 1 n=1 Tax=Cyphellophora attinorum TaxID=1664694 RepID=A0A0N1H8T1_9EURO|nr:Paxillin-like protein 1 [Phialophora attinorum]KPI39837.1 Paxillin-like protein 1 [Phialophora attinorum]